MCISEPTICVTLRCQGSPSYTRPDIGAEAGEARRFVKWQRPREHAHSLCRPPDAHFSSTTMTLSVKQLEPLDKTGWLVKVRLTAKISCVK